MNPASKEYPAFELEEVFMGFGPWPVQNHFLYATDTLLVTLLQLWHSSQLFSPPSSCLLIQAWCVCPGCSLACAVVVMKNPGDVASRQLDILLEAALLRETRLWKVPVFKNGCIQGAVISSSQHQEMIFWLGEMSRLFQFCPETFALGVCVLNRLLSTVKAQPKYLRCIAFTSLVLAAKINEEDEVIGSVRDLVVQSGCNFSTAEILRMERIILDKLQWDLYTATPVDFIHIAEALLLLATPPEQRAEVEALHKQMVGSFHALLVCSHPHLLPSIGRGSLAPASDPGSAAARLGHQKTPPGFHAVLWTRQVQHCMACHQLWQFKGSTLALAIITLELEVLTPDWFSVFTDLLKKAQVDSGELIHCKEIVDEYLHSLEFSLPANAVYIFDSAQIQEEEPGRCAAQRPGQARRRGGGEQGDGDEYYDGFGCLYNEEKTPGSEGKDDAGAQKNVSPCPPLHPAVN